MPDESRLDAEAWVLTTEPGLELLEAVDPVAEPGPAELSRWRRRASAEQVSAAIRIASARRRGVAKFSRAGAMWLDPVGLEQATAEPVARHKASRFAGERAVDLCAGIGGDSLALAATATVLSVDADQGMCRRLLWNARVYGVSSSLLAIRARAERFALPRSSLVHIDPDRRAHSATRARDLADYVPGLGYLKSLPSLVRGGAIKLGPASDFARHFDTSGTEIELVSLRGECKEATAWFGELASCERRATRLPENATWTSDDGPRNPRVSAGTISTWIFDPDPALIRAGLLDGFAAEHGLQRCAEGVDYLTSGHHVASPFLAPFEVLEILPLEIKRLRRLISANEVGTLEIKTRGVELRPEDFRRQLRPSGTNSGTLLLIGGAGAARAVLAKRRGENRDDCG